MLSLNSSIASMIGIEGHLSRLRLQHADAVVEIFVGARPAAVDPRQQRSAARQRHARRKRDQRNEIAAVQRQRFDLFARYVKTDRAVRRLQQAALSPLTSTVWAGLSDLQLNVQLDLVRQPKDDTGLLVGPESRAAQRSANTVPQADQAGDIRPARR